MEISNRDRDVLKWQETPRSRTRQQDRNWSDGQTGQELVRWTDNRIDQYRLPHHEEPEELGSVSFHNLQPDPNSFSCSFAEFMKMFRIKRWFQHFEVECNS